MARRRSFVSILAILLLLHAYIGLRLLPAMGAGPVGMLAGAAGQHRSLADVTVAEADVIICINPWHCSAPEL